MADTKLADLTALTTPSGDDILYIVDDPAGTPLDRKIALDNLFTRGTITADAPVLNMSQTWNNAAVTFTGLKFNVASDTSAAASLLMDLQVGGTSQSGIDKNGNAHFGTYRGFIGAYGGQTYSGSPAGTSVYLPQLGGFTFYNTNGGSLGGRTIDTFLTRRGAANLRFGAADAAAPVAQTLSVQSVVAGTSNIAGANTTFTASQGTGTGAGGSIIFQVAPAGSSGTAQNALATALTITSAQRVQAASWIDSVNGYTVNSGSADVVIGAAGSYGVTLRSTTFLAWTNADATATQDVFLRRDDANILALRNGANAQAFRAYNTYTDASNFERLSIGWSSNVARVGINTSGTGVTRDLVFGTGGGSQWAINTGGHWVTYGSDNTYDIGTSSGSRPRNVFVVGTVTTGTVVASIIRNSNFNTENNTHTVLTFTNSSDNLLFATGGTSPRINFCGTTSSFPALKRVSANLQVIAADGTSSAGLIVGNQALATTATDGFLYVPTCAGTPTGTPTAQTGTAPIVINTTNNKLYFYSDGQWRDAGP